MGTDHQLISGDVSRSVQEALAGRRDQLLDLYERLLPGVVLVELFPFGRKKLAPELIPLLDRSKRDPRRPLVATSVRDILVTGRNDQRRHDDRAARHLDEYFDLVLVHADPQFVRLEDSFAPAVGPETEVTYTGFVARPEAPFDSGEIRPGSIVVSAGGGWVGGSLLRAAADAHQTFHDRHGLATTLITGPLASDVEQTELMMLARDSEHLTVITSVPDLLSTLRSAAVSISQCGYNTTLDLVRAGLPAVVVPFGDDRENEQPRRAARLAQCGLVTVVDPADLGAGALVAAVDDALADPPTAVSWSLEGATNTAMALSEAAGAKWRSLGTAP